MLCAIEAVLVGLEPHLGECGDIWMVVEPSKDVEVYRKAMLSHGKKRYRFSTIRSIHDMT